MKSRGKIQYLISLGSILLFLLIWSIAAGRIDAPIILPTPLEVFSDLLRILGRGDFWLALGNTVVRGLIGFALSFGLALAAGVAGGLSRGVEAFLRPFLTIIRTTPVMSVILLGMIWFKTDNVPIFVCLLTIFPVITASVMEGIRNVDPGLLSMAQVYKVPMAGTILHVHLPSILPYVIAGAGASIGLTWKVVIAAEVLSQPFHALGTGLQYAQATLETGEVFAWTIAAVTLSGISEFIFHVITNRIPWRAGSSENQG
ncbi:MAG: ABC transporter permease subunit [Spirochaetales bacterium]|nr:ABC transporter permease subunit [Spirochaetales bacterium]